MQLNALDTIRLGYVRSKSDQQLPLTNYSNISSIDLTIGEVICKDDNDSEFSGIQVHLNPQQSALIISEEIIRVPDDHIAYVFLKNGLSQRGFLALNTGIIDAGYVGPISTLIINFSKNKNALPSGNLRSDKEFFRVVFHKVDNNNTISQPINPSTPFTNTDYEKYKLGKINNLKHLPKTFLEPTVLKDQIRNEIFDKISDFSIVRIGVVIGVVGVLFTLVSMARDAWFGWQYDIKDNIRNQEKYELKIEGLNDDIKELKQRIEKLELPPKKRNKN